jgi:hypothetical protein
MAAAASVLDALGWKNEPERPTRDDDDVHPLIVSLAEKLWGRGKRTGRDWRFGSRGSKSVDVRTGTWFDFEADVGGGVRDLIKMVQASGASAGPRADRTPVLVRAVDVVPRAKDWLWEGHLLRGSLELLTGIPGLGKSQLQCHFVACVTAGQRWPDGTSAGTPRSVIMVTAEDALDQEVVPRLMAAGADLNRVHILKYIKQSDDRKRQFLLSEDLELLEKKIAEIGDVALVTIDPITAYMGSKTDSHKATEVRSQLGPLKDFTERVNVAVSAITHPAKNAGQRAIDHFIGSQAFIAAARIGHACFAELVDDIPTNRYLFAHVKHNPSTQRATLAYRISEMVIGQDQNGTNIGAPRVTFDEGSIDITADAIIAAAREGGRGGDQQAVRHFVYNTLVENGGSMPSKELAREAAEQHGYTLKQLRRAREALGIVAVKDGTRWIWQLPPAGAPL